MPDSRTCCGFSNGYVIVFAHVRDRTLLDPRICREKR
jgi:hypothetical protein